MRVRGCRRHLTAAVVGLGVAATPAAAADRGLELVTPPGSDSRVFLSGGGATPNGDAVCFNAERVLAGSPSNGLVTGMDGYCAWRGARGWETRWVTGPAVKEPAAARGAAVTHVAPDASRVVFASETGIYPDFKGGTPPSAVYGTLSAYMWEGNAMPRWLAPTPVPEMEERPNTVEGSMPGGVVQREAVATSEDLRHGVFYSSLPLLPADQNDEVDVYEWTPDGTIRLVSRDASGAAVGGWAPMGGEYLQVVAQPGTMSRDGSRIFFLHRGPIDGQGAVDRLNVFLREGDTLTHLSPRRDGEPAQNVEFVGASDDGRIVYLRSAEQLTDTPVAGGDALYRYELGGSMRLVATNPAGIRFFDLSADGSTVVYSDGTSSQLMINRNGVEHMLGNLDAFWDSYALIGSVASYHGRRPLRISADGSVVVFAAIGPFAGSTPGAGFPPPTQVYRWTEQDGVRWISTRDGVTAPIDSAWIGTFASQFFLSPRGIENAANLLQYSNTGRVLADDGRFFFETRDRLVDADVNEFYDVYEWDQGRVRLISPGDQTEHAFYHDNSADGKTVFFTTTARLIPELDRNVTSDLYAAREGGGFPLPQPPRACEGEDCQGPPTPPPPPQQPPASETFTAPRAEVDQPPRPALHRLVAIKAKQRRALVRNGRTVLRVRVNQPGIVAVRSRAVVRGRSVMRRDVVRRAVRAGEVKVPIALTARVRGLLRDGRAVRLTLLVDYSGAEDPIRRVVVLRG